MACGGARPGSRNQRTFKMHFALRNGAAHKVALAFYVFRLKQTTNPQRKWFETN